MTRALVLVAALLAVGCTATPVHLRQFEHVENGSRILYTVDMFEEGERRLNGYWASFHPGTGVKLAEGAHLHGKMHGVWTWWSPAGEITGQKHYDSGAVASERTVPPWWSY